MGDRLARKVLLIGWDAADWQIINPLLETGLMPTLNSFIESGVMGNLSTINPALSPMLWTSIATGKRPYKHGIYGFIEPRPDGQGVQTVSSTSRKVKAIWNMLTQSGLKSNIVSWYASHPAEPINGAAISNQYRLRGPQENPVRPPPETFHPRRLSDALSELAVHPAEMGVEHVAPFIPRLFEIPEDKRKPLDKLAECLADCATTHSAATYLMQNEPWDFMAVYYETLDLIGHHFMKFHPPRMANVAEDEFEWFKDVIVGAYRFHDMLLDTLLKLAGEETTVILMSDHGFYSNRLRPVPVDGKEPPPPAWHRPQGIVSMKGPSIQKDERIYGATILDITPTILTLFGLPVGKDMDGKVLVTAFSSVPKIEWTESWDELPGEAGLHPPDMRNDPIEAQEAVRQLAELGYIDLPGGDDAAKVEAAIKESKFNLACSLIGGNRYSAAADIFRELHENSPRDARYAMALTQAYINLSRFDDAAAMLEKLRAGGIQTVNWHLAQAKVLFGMKHEEEAMKCLELVEKIAEPNPNLYCEIAQIHDANKNRNAARGAFEKALELDPDHASALCGLGVVSIHENRCEEAVDLLLRALGLMYFYPRAHYYLGVALSGLGWWDRAISAFEVCVRMYPRMVAAHRHLAEIHSRLGHAPQSMAYQQQMRQLLEEARQAGIDVSPESLIIPTENRE